MTRQQTTQQFTPVILSLDLNDDQQATVEHYLRQSSTHPHVDHIIWLNQPDQTFGIEQWRDLLPQIQSVISHQLLCVAILHADTLSKATQNAMLKSLEEPPPLVQFLLVTNRPTTLLPTIQSRCHLHRISQENHFSSQPEISTLLSSVVTGSISDALIASDQFNDRDQAKTWLLRTLVWSEKQLNKSSQSEEIINLDWPAWINALLTAHQQLEQNLNVKLVMDQLFLTLVTNSTLSS